MNLNREIKRLQKRLKRAKGNNVSYKYHSTQVNLNDHMHEKDAGFIKTQHLINDEDIYREMPQVKGVWGYRDHPEEEYGLENTPHITVLYGLTNGVDFFDIHRKLKSFGPLEVTIGNISSFRNDDKPYDVLKLAIVSDRLIELHNYLKRWENEENFPDYKPHSTLAYVKKGTCKELEGPCAWTGTTYKVDEIKFSHRDGYKLDLPLT